MRGPGSRFKRLGIFVAVIASFVLLALVSNTEDAVALGRRVFAENCAACHGTHGEGGSGDPSNPFATDAEGRYYAPPHDQTGHTWHHSDDQLKDIIIGGSSYPEFVSAMPAFGDKLTDFEIDAVLAYIKTLWEEEQRQFQAEVGRNPTGGIEFFQKPTP